MKLSRIVRSMVLVLCWVTPGALLAQQAPTADPPNLRALFDEANKLYDAHKWKEAEEKYLAIWAIQKSYDVAANLADVKLALGKNAEAATFFAYAIKTFPAGGKPSVRRAYEERFAQVKAKVGTLLLTVTPPHAAVRINDRPLEAAALSDDVFVEPGEITITCDGSPGFEAFTTRLTLKAGERQQVPIALTPTPTATPTATATTQPPPSKLPAVIAFGVGGAGLVLGAVTGGVSVAKFGEVKAACGGDSSCPASQRGEIETGKTLGHVSTAGFVVAGLGVAAGVVLLLVPIGQKKTQTSVLVGPSFVGVKGAF